MYQKGDRITVMLDAVVETTRTDQDGLKVCIRGDGFFAWVAVAAPDVIIEPRGEMVVYVTSAGSEFDEAEEEQTAHWTLEGAQAALRKAWANAQVCEFYEDRDGLWLLSPPSSSLVVRSPDTFIVKKLKVQD